MPMSGEKKSRKELEAEIEELSRRLEETEQVLHAIQTGAVDAVVVSTPEGAQIYTLQGAELPYRILVETMNEGAATLGTDGTILYCNMRLAAMLQAPQEKIIGSLLVSHLIPEHRAFLETVIKSSGEGCAKLELALLTASGEELPVLLSCCGGELPDGPAFSVIFTDIGARKQAERTILRLNRLYAVLSGTNHAIVHATDRLSIFQEFCRVAVELGGFRLAWAGLVDNATGLIKVAAASGEAGYLEGMGQSAERGCEGMAPIREAIDKRSHHICNDLSGNSRHGHDRAASYGLYSLATVAIKQEEEVVGALTLYAEEKNFFDAQQVELLQQVGAEVSFALDKLHQSLLRDQAEQALQDETEERLRAVEQLRKNEQLLIHQSRQAALGEMIGNIAHQWRQPLNSLALLVQQAPLYYALGEVDQDFIDKNANQAMQLIEHMSQTIDDFRNFFRPNKKKNDFSIKEEVTRTLSLMEGSFRGQEIEMRIEAESDPVIRGYANEFSQVLLNILINARDALTERGVAAPKVVISIRTENGRGVVTIADNAGGIPEEIIGKIFDPYFTTKGPQSGTGVGLFMAKTIIEKNMGGRLSVRNTASGAEFKIEV